MPSIARRCAAEARLFNLPIALAARPRIAFPSQMDTERKSVAGKGTFTEAVLPMLDGAGTYWGKGIVPGKSLRDPGIVITSLKNHVSIAVFGRRGNTFHLA